MFFINFSQHGGHGTLGTVEPLSCDFLFNPKIFLVAHEPAGIDFYPSAPGVNLPRWDCPGHTKKVKECSEIVDSD
jgi:hypothetical protein